MGPASEHSESSATARPYHHGQLAEALLEAAVARARDGGPSAIGLREVTRAVGVTPRAAYRHYADRRALVVAVARVALAGMAAEISRRVEATEASGDEDPDVRAARRLQAVGDGYIAAALAEPGLFETAMFGLDDMLESRPEDSDGPYGLLLASLRRLADEGAIDPDRIPVLAATCWSAVHGFATLATQGPLRELPPDAARALGAEVVREITRGVTGLDLASNDPGEDDGLGL